MVVGLTLGSCSDATRFKVPLQAKFKSAEAYTQGNVLTVTTGTFERTWELTENGLVTRTLASDGAFEILGDIPEMVDWKLPGILNPNAPGQLISLSANAANDQDFTNEHLEISAEFDYPEQGIRLKYVIWAYPDAPGLRTQLFLKKNSDDLPFTDQEEKGRAEYLPLAHTDQTHQLIGYYNDTQHRNTHANEILKDSLLNGQFYQDWANIVVLRQENKGVMLVQESHKCVNQAGIFTGGYLLDSLGLSATGLGIDHEHITENYRPLWAYWTIGFQGDTTELQTALKRFDRMRYPIDPKRDIYIMANNWGTGSSGEQSKFASREENILKEIESQKDLGIDLQQVDDGWQGLDYNNWDYVASASNATYGTYDVYPEGWKNIKKAAATSGLRLGLWAASHIPGEDLLKHFKSGGFTSYKLDFANLNTYDKFHDFVNKVRTFILATDHKVRVNWDVTENPARIGYFFGREYGNIYLENRKPKTPENVIYKPYLVLRDAWQVARYTNLNKFQVSIQNIEMVDRNGSDAYLHNHPYSVAIALMGSPIFFQETQYYSQEARDQIRPLITAYRKHRHAMYQGYVFPIGDTPDNASWTGFQNHNFNSNDGYLTLFRELNNRDNEHAVQLHLLKGKQIILTDLMTQETVTKQVDTNGWIQFSMDTPADFRFYKYRTP
ncbi:hypothetical protein B7P33_00385 [Sediminicola luteus]|uniref:Alpha-galactosidase n=2 Tax=Sediminicola luteus TaxID=319238 RepID=A0A2A4GA23_9FLAO|nr:hypothetical protein B7P33_00385 [Sediminicola luteus]